MTWTTYIGTKQIDARPATRPTFEGLEEGYQVLYPDGHVSWSPKAAFDAAYCQDGEFDFGHALFLLKRGAPMRRRGWNAPHTVLLQEPDEHSLMTQPYIYMVTAGGQQIPWVASHADMLATDWEIVE
jgi:hypothetical protein